MFREKSHYGQCNVTASHSFICNEVNPTVTRSIAFIRFSTNFHGLSVLRIKLEHLIPDFLEK